MIIDIHNHIGPSPDGGHGTLDELLANMEKYGVKKSVLFATDEEQRHPTYSSENDRIIEAQDQHSDQIIAFARIVPSQGAAALEELKRCYDLGVKGLKLKGNDGFHPEDAVRLFDFIKDKKNFPVLMHTDHEFEENKPTTWEKYIKDYPQIDFIMAHGGKADYKICGEIVRKYSNAYVDTSTISFHRTKTIYEIVGARKILFASDYPYSHLAVELKKYEVLIQDPRDQELILYKNAERILGV